MLSTAACSSSGGSSSTSSSSSASGGGIPSTVNVVATYPLTGPAAFAGLAAQKGAQLAVKEINDQGFLGDGVTLSVDYQDTKGEIQTGQPVSRLPPSPTTA